MTDVGRHRSDIARVHRDAGTRLAAILVGDVPDDLVGQLQEPLDAVVAMEHRQHEFLGGRTEQALLANGGDRRIPRHVRARQVLEETERVQRVLKAGRRVNLRLVLANVRELAVDRQLVAQRRIAFEARHTLGGNSRALDRGDVVTMFGAERGAGFFGRRERVEAFVDPVPQDRLEGRHDERCIKLLHVIDAGFLETRVVRTGVHVDLAVVIARADHFVEVDPAVEETPRDVAHHRAQEVIGVHLV